jgi:hypothetical protein
MHYLTPFARAALWLNLACLSALPFAASAGGDISPAPAAVPVELRLPDLNGRERTLGELRGQVVLGSVDIKRARSTLRRWR